MKKIIKSLFAIVILFTISGCSLKDDTMDDIEIYATNYPTEYITNYLYKEHSNITSIYPNGVNLNEYTLTKKQIEDYSKSNLYIFNGLSEKEKSYVTEFRKENKNLKIIDTTLYMEYDNSIEELWLDPSNFLMMAQNIKKGFKEYINNYYLNEDINTNYEQLKIEVSNLDAKLKQTISNSDQKIIITSSNLFKYLEKYGITVYTLDEKTIDEKTLEEVKQLLKTNKVTNIIIKENEDINGTIQNLTKTYGVKTLEWHTLSNITETQKNEGQDYFTLMNENIDTLKEELYN